MYSTCLLAFFFFSFFLFSFFFFFSSHLFAEPEQNVPSPHLQVDIADKRPGAELNLPNGQWTLDNVLCPPESITDCSQPPEENGVGNNNDHGRQQMEFTCTNTTLLSSPLLYSPLSSLLFSSLALLSSTLTPPSSPLISNLKSTSRPLVPTV